MLNKTIAILISCLLSVISTTAFSRAKCGTNCSDHCKGKAIVELCKQACFAERDLDCKGIRADATNYLKKGGVIACSAYFSPEACAMTLKGIEASERIAIESGIFEKPEGADKGNGVAPQVPQPENNPSSMIRSSKNDMCLYTDNNPWEKNVRVVPCNTGAYLGRLWKYDYRNHYMISQGNKGCLYTDNHPFRGNVRVVPCNRGARKGRQWEWDKSNTYLISALTGKCLYTDDHEYPNNVRVVPCDRGAYLGRLWKK